MIHAVILSTLLTTAIPVQPEAKTPVGAIVEAVGAEIEAVEDTPPARSFRLRRAALELGAAMALGVAWYESQIEVNKRDFDFDRTWSEQARRLTTSDGYRFDDNARYLNVGHSIVGSYYHLFARVNGGSMLQALLFDFTASSVWELTVEHREVVSVNDTITTAIGGVPLGEGLYRIGDFFARSRPTVTNRVLMGVLSPARAIGYLHGDTVRASTAGFDEHGLATDAHHRFVLSYGAAAALSGTDIDAWQSTARADFELVDLPSYGRPSHRDRTLHGGEITRIAVAYTGSHHDMQSTALLARSSLWGRYHQNTHESGRGLAGHSAFVGSSTAFELSYHDFGDVTDFLTAVHLVGPSADVTLHRSPWQLRLAADLYPDFAMIRPFALDRAAARDEDVPGQSTLKHDYYYALGLTAAARAEARFGQARAGAAIEWNAYDAVEGLDRHQKPYVSPTGRPHEAITDDPAMADQRLRLRLYSESPLPFTDLEIGASLDYLQRSGTATEASREREDLRVSFHGIYAL